MIAEDLTGEVFGDLWNEGSSKRRKRLLDQYRVMAEELGIAERVRFTGLINNPTDEGVFDASDLYCQPSLWQEACPLAVLEAMSWKLPVVASRIGGLPELVEDGKTGLLAPTGDATAVADCVLLLVRDEGLRRSMGDAGYQAVMERHQLNQTVEQYVQFVVEGIPARSRGAQTVVESGLTRRINESKK